jgi:hypothetical protein
MGWKTAPTFELDLNTDVQSLKCWKRIDGNLCFLATELIQIDSMKDNAAIVANVRSLDQISRELHTNFDYKEKIKQTLKQLLRQINMSKEWWKIKLDRIKKYSTSQLGNEQAGGYA